ncbi:MAG: helix-turn-helix domain-containing protein [Rhodoglobus sp.]
MNTIKPTDAQTPRFNYESAAEFLGMSVRQVKRARESGALGCIKLGGLHVRFSEQQLNDYIAACTVNPTV